MSEEAKHTPGPWKVMADPDNAGRHPCHDNRWIASADAEVEFGYDPREGQWALKKGVLICEMRDHVEAPSANANLIAAAPEMLAALKAFPSVTIDMRKSARHNAKEIIAIAVWAQEYCAPAIAKAEGRAG